MDNVGQLEVLPYALPDSQLIDVGADSHDFFFWVPDQTYLVLGQSNQADSSLYVDLVLKDHVKVLKRPSGGESVILTPRTLVLAVRLISEKLENPQVYFKRINGIVIDALSQAGIADLAYRGISDVAIGPRKILGSSIYRKKHMVFYHAVLNISEDIHLIAKYLRHPGKEPDYRKGRSHHEFVTSIREAGYAFSAQDIKNALEQGFKNAL